MKCHARLGVSVERHNAKGTTRRDGSSTTWLGGVGGGGALPALVWGILIKYLSCVSLSHVRHLPLKIQE